MSDLSQIAAAIEASNKAFEEFKTMNEKRLALIEKGAGGDGELKVQMEKAFADMSEQKALIEQLEAKLKRPPMGGKGGNESGDDTGAEHRKSFVGYITKGTKYAEDDLQYANGVSIKSLNIGDGGAGGYAVPKVIDGQVEELVVNISPVRSIASVQQISTPDFHKLVNRRGTSSGWVGETQTRVETNTPLLADINPPMGDLYANPMATQQMLDDAFFNAEQWLADNLATEFARAEGAAFINGTGINQPIGFLAGTCAATADATRDFGTLEYLATGNSGAFDTLSSTVNPADDLFTLVSKLKAAYRQGSRWVLNKNTLFAIMAFKD